MADEAIDYESQRDDSVLQVVGKKAADFTLRDQNNRPFHLYDALRAGAVLLAFYPGDFKLVCTKQLCNYRDAFEGFRHFPIQLVGISHNTIEQHQKFAEAYHIPFPLLSDPGNAVAKVYGCRSFFMLGRISRAVTIINSQGIQLYRYVEPTTATHRRADKLMGILNDLKSHSLI